MILKSLTLNSLPSTCLNFVGKTTKNQGTCDSVEYKHRLEWYVLFFFLTGHFMAQMVSFRDGRGRVLKVGDPSGQIVLTAAFCQQVSCGARHSAV